MRISKTLSSEIAKKTLRKKQMEIELLQTQISKKLAELCIASLPHDIQDVFSKHKKFIKTSVDVRMQADNIKINGSWPLISFNEDGSKEYIEIPSPDAYNFPLIKVSKKDGDTINKWVDKLHVLQPEYKKLLSDLSSALFNLRTYARISETIPEAVPHIPKVTENTLLQVDIKNLRSRITN